MSANDQEEEHQVETGLPVVTQSAKSSEEKPSLNMKNWLNLLFYIFNVVFTFGVGSLGWFSGQTNGELSLKYQVCTACECICTFWSSCYVSPLSHFFSFYIFPVNRLS